MFKALLLLLNFAKLGPLLKTGGTMILSVFAYAWIVGWRYAVGFVLRVGTFAAVGVFAWMVTRQPIVAAVLTRVILLGSWMASLANPDPTSLVQMISITRRFESFNAGMIDSADIVWHAAVIAAFLALSIRRLDRDRLVGQAL